MVSAAFRAESGDGSWSMPISYNIDNKSIGVGFHVRLGSLIFGTENINFLFDQSKGIKPTFYVGISISKKLNELKIMIMMVYPIAKTNAQIIKA